MFYDNQAQTRNMFFSAWKKHVNQEALTPLEEQIVLVMLDHPEYHDILANPAQYQHHQWLPEMGESNPFLHMGLHLAIREQIATNRPTGIQDVFLQLLNKHHTSLEVEHIMIDTLAEMLWEAQQNGQMPDEAVYLESLKRLL